MPFGEGRGGDGLLTYDVGGAPPAFLGQPRVVSVDRRTFAKVISRVGLKQGPILTLGVPAALVLRGSSIWQFLWSMQRQWRPYI